MARPDSFMPLYWAEYWKDTAGLSAVEQCAYLNLLGAMWTNHARLPVDNDRLQRLSRVSETEWAAASVTVTAYFDRDGDWYTQKRLTIEYAKAMKGYSARVAHIKEVNEGKKTSDRKQTLKAVTVHSDCDTTHNSHSPNGDSDATASETRKPRTQRRTRLADDWKPSEAGVAYASAGGLTREEIDRLAAEFVRYWRSGNAKDRGLKADWETTWLGNIDRNVERIIAGRTRGGQSRQNGSGAGSIVDVVARLKAKAGGEGDLPGGGVHGATDFLRAAEHDGNQSEQMLRTDSHVVESDDAERMFRAARGTEADDGLPAGAGPRSGGPIGTVCAEAGGVPGGCSAEGPDHTAEHEQVVADLGRAERPTGPVHRQAPQIAEVDNRGPIPEFMRRTAKA